VNGTTLSLTIIDLGGRRVSGSISIGLSRLLASIVGTLTVLVVHCLPVFFVRALLPYMLPRGDQGLETDQGQVSSQEQDAECSDA
jgi:hypothetical protein